MERSRNRESSPTGRGRESERDDDRGRGRDRDDAPRGRDRDEAPARSRGRDDDDSRSTRSRDRDEAPRGRGRDDDSGSSGYSYRRRTAEDVDARKKVGGRDFDSILREDINSFTPNDGDNTIRILPPTWADPKHYGIDLWVHYGVGPDEGSYLCLKKMKGEDCPICEERDRANREGEDEGYVKDLKPTLRALFYLVDRDHEQDGVKAWAAPRTIDSSVTAVSMDKRTREVLPIDDPQDGYDIEFSKKGKSINTKYEGVAISRRSSPLGSKKWLQFAIDNPLNSILEYYSYEYIAKVFGGGGAHKSRSARDADRDDDRSSGRDRDSGRESSRDSRSDRDSGDSGRSRGRETEREEPRGRGRREEPEYTWESVHGMTGDELEALVEAEKLKDINPNKAESDKELADWICEDLKLKPAERQRSREEPKKEEESPRDRLRNMREKRNVEEDDIPY